MFCPTTETSTIAKLKRAIFTIRRFIESPEATRNSAAIAGVYIEGPFLGQAGRHPRHILREPSIELLTDILESGGGAVSSILIAPEARGAKRAARFLRDNGIKTRFGHTDATYEETMEHIKAGADCCTHIFRHTPPISGDDIGAAGAALLSGDVFAEIAPLCDGLSTAAAQLAYSLKKDNLICVTDSGNGEQAYMNRCVMYLYEQCGIPFEAAIASATAAPARYLGVFDERGSIEVGKRADLTAIDSTGAIAFTMIGGEIIYSRWR